MRYEYRYVILFVALTAIANPSYSQYKPKRPAVKFERPEISFELVQAFDGVLKIRMTNNGKTPFRYYDSLIPTHGNAHFFRNFDCAPSRLPTAAKKNG